MDKYEALEFISNRLIKIDTDMMDDDSSQDNHPIFNEKWLLLEAQSRIIDGHNPELVLKTVLDVGGKVK